METEIRRLWSPEYSSNNADLSNDWNPKSTEVPVKKNPESSTLNPESKARNPESKTVLDYPTWGDTIISQRDFPLHFVFFLFSGHIPEAAFAKQ